VTPFTSHLILEDGERVASALGRGARLGFLGDDGDVRDERRSRLFDELARGGLRAADDPAGEHPPAPRSAAAAEAKATEQLDALGRLQVGAAPVAMSRDLKKAREGAEALRDKDRFDATASRRVRGKTFHLVGDTWVDGALTPELRSRARTVVAYSDEYFALLREHRDLAAWLAIGEKVIVVMGEWVLEIG
jgi:hypothetical protein